MIHINLTRKGSLSVKSCKCVWKTYKDALIYTNMLASK